MQAPASIEMVSQNANQPVSSPTDPDPAEYLNDPRFHQSFTLAPGPDRPDPFQVTYCDYGYRNADDPEREHVLLFCGPLLGSRYLHVAKDALAKKHGVRIINPDRPGFGGTTHVDAPDRVRLWLEIVPALLQHLGIRHVSLAAHSGGTIYALNTLLHQRHILSPSRPYVALAAPWVHQSRSGSALMILAGGLPEAVLGGFHTLAGFSQKHVAPVASAVSGFFPSMQAVSGLLPTSLRTSPASPPPPPLAAEVSENARMAEFEERIWPRLIEMVYAGDMRGLSQDAILLLKRAGHPGYWGSWGDYDELVTLLAEAERNLESTAKLKVDVFWAEEDHMIGVDKGPKWFEGCWRAEQCRGAIEYASCVVPGTDHEGIVELKFDMFERILRSVGGTNEGDLELPSTT
ncbi:hypothetical protein CORC01_12712 [Colletotrichum orchidophilum]|uniref:AB hydrolase-1 domain-containing protein n=1 Tax=Colletotrichum orchidophilum TaxID=1209926 RepID=A0A1G4AS87_9PEZI|nr:uncharacterized protein CORC01_12712 [Colletotrichum orchidophilum]OHE91976.1 hypothetical protein CORC01_12712 [Colletotrichum orchidophilum]